MFPLCRSITGDGIRETLRLVARDVPLEIVETPTGTEVLDWVVPNEWNVRGAWIDGPDGARVVDFEDSNLHVLNYSAPIDATVSLDELREHVFTHHSDPDLVPYRTSYYVERWGFCMSRRRLDALAPGDYRVVVDSTLEPGAVTYGEAVLHGATDDEVLLTTYACHPSLANDNLSGVALLAEVGRALAAQPALRYTYRLLWGPGTIGSICWLANNREVVERVRHGLVVSSVGDPGPLTYKKSRRGNAEIDAAVAHVLRSEPGSRVLDWSPYGGDERQFCSPGFDLPVGAFSRTPADQFPEYHSSADDLDFVRPEHLGDSFAGARRRHRRHRVERHVHEPEPLRRAPTRATRPLPRARRRVERGDGAPVGAEPVRRHEEPPRDRRAGGYPVRRRSGGRRESPRSSTPCWSAPV